MGILSLLRKHEHDETLLDRFILEKFDQKNIYKITQSSDCVPEYNFPIMLACICLYTFLYMYINIYTNKVYIYNINFKNRRDQGLMELLLFQGC